MFSRAGGFAAVLAALLTFAGMQDAAAQQTVKVGAIYPLSGNAASAGGFSKAAIELAVDLINTGNPNLKDVPLADGKVYRYRPPSEKTQCAGLPGKRTIRERGLDQPQRREPAAEQQQLREDERPELARAAHGRKAGRHPCPQRPVRHLDRKVDERRT